MSFISEYIAEKNSNGEKVLSVFLTSGFPNKSDFSDLAVSVLEAGADMLEIGFPFSDPLADGPIIQHSSQTALDNGVKLEDTFNYISEIRKQSNKPLIMMGYSNPVMNYGIENFAKSAKEAGVNGVIIPDVPIEEYDNFFDASFSDLDKILLITPTTSDKRISLIDEKSSGFIYCVSVKGTTGEQKHSAKDNSGFVEHTYSLVKKNKMLVGFGISKEEDVKSYAPNCDGVIVGSAVIKSLMNEKSPYKNTVDLVRRLKKAL